MIRKRVVFTSIGKANLVEEALESPQANEVLIANNYTAVSVGTELANCLALPNTVAAKDGFPHHPGYSGAGKVIAIGNSVTTLQIGDRCIVNWGGHCSHTIKKENDVLKIEDNAINLLDASFAHIASFSFLGVRKLKIEIGESAMIIGCGILGAIATQIAALSGAIPVIVSDLDPERRKLALTLGATHTLSPDDPDFTKKVHAYTDGKGPNAIVEVTGNAAALQQALDVIAPQGRISLLGCTRVPDAAIDFYKHVHLPGISLIGAHTFNRPRHESTPGQWTERDDYRSFLKLVAADKLQVRPLISEIIAPETCNDVFSHLAHTKHPPLGIVFDWKNEL